MYIRFNIVHYYINTVQVLFYDCYATFISTFYCSYISFYCFFRVQVLFTDYYAFISTFYCTYISFYCTLLVQVLINDYYATCINY